MSKVSLRQFDPENIAQLDLRMWRSYYNGQYLKLFFLLVSLLNKFFGIKYLQSMRAAWHAALASMDFRRNIGKEDAQRVLKNLERSLEIIHANSTEVFDYRKAAKLELEWWLVHRYPKRYTISLEDALAAAMAVLYKVDPSKLGEYARNRAKAMRLRDEINSSNQARTWEEIASLLNNSYKSLHKAVN
jgi:hypothetical protein